MTGSPSFLEPRRYSPDELLSLRTSLPIKSVINQLNKQIDLACIVGLTGRTPKDSSGLSLESRGLVDVTNGRRGQLSSKSHTTERSEESEYQATTHNLKNSRGEVRWSLRSRDTSDRTSQPHSAPADIVAQQSENFQRFYRAVVSPTHVRVTAGGRIVPNTRTVAPPLFQWNGDKLHFEHPKRQIDLDKVQAGSWLQSLPPPPPGFPPLLPPGGILPQFLPRPMPMMASQVQPSSNGTQQPPVSRESPALQQIKLSPPTQFDQTKPFVFNGHVVYPVPPGFQPPPTALPMPLHGNPGLLPQNSIPTPAGFYPAQFPGPMAGMANPYMFPSQLSMGMPGMIQPLENTPTMTPYLPMMSPMGPSSITDLIKSQIHFLQIALKQHEIQLATNNHQFDETLVEHQRNMLLSQINNMEIMLENQLALERCTKSGPQEDKNHSGLGISMTTSQEKKVSSTTLNSEAIITSSDEVSVAISKTTDNSESPPAEKTKEEKKQPVRSESASKSRLTLAAAMAPPFQPRTQTAIAQASQVQLGNEIPRSSLTSPLEQAPFQTQAQIESRLLARSSNDWGYGGLPRVAASSTTLHRTQSALEQPTQTQTSAHGSGPALHKSNTFHGQTNTLMQDPPIIFPGLQPYLVGTLPAGLSVDEARPSDVIYSRELTFDEVQARHLYWGKAPRSVIKGLPKFDGMSFYPASPVKQVARLASVAPSLNSTKSQTLVAPGPEPDPEKSFDEHGSPARSLNPSSSGLVATVAGLDLEKLFDQYGSPSRTPQPASPKPCTTRSAAIQQSQFGSAGHEYGYRALSLGATEYQVPPGPDGKDGLVTPLKDDFSNLFLERGVPGYESPSPTRQGMAKSKVRFDKEPVTPKNQGSLEGTFNTGSPNSRDNGNADTESVDHDDSLSNTSTVEIHTSTPRNNNRSPGSDRETTRAERTENSRSTEQHTFFLPNMLRNAQAQMSGPALSGTISPAVAQGYLPQYRGSAAASLAPSMVSIPATEYDSERYMAKAEFSRGPVVAVTPLNATNFSENHPMIRNRLQRSTQQSAENMGAEGYMRYLSQKDGHD